VRGSDRQLPTEQAKDYCGQCIEDEAVHSSVCAAEDNNRSRLPGQHHRDPAYRRRQASLPANRPCVGAQPNVSRCRVVKHRQFSLPTAMAVCSALACSILLATLLGASSRSLSGFGPWAGRDGEG
jgi:hypothetical protein